VKLCCDMLFDSVQGTSFALIDFVSMKISAAKTESIDMELWFK